MKKKLAPVLDFVKFKEKRLMEEVEELQEFNEFHIMIDLASETMDIDSGPDNIDLARDLALRSGSLEMLLSEARDVLMDRYEGTHNEEYYMDDEDLVRMINKIDRII